MATNPNVKTLTFPSRKTITRMQEATFFMELNQILIETRLCENLRNAGLIITFKCSTCGKPIPLILGDICVDCWRKRRARKFEQQKEKRLLRLP